VIEYAIFLCGLAQQLGMRQELNECRVSHSTEKARDTTLDVEKYRMQIGD